MPNLSPGPGSHGLARWPLLAAVAAGLALAAVLAWGHLRRPAARLQSWLAAHPEADVAGVGPLPEAPEAVALYPLTYLAAEGCEFLDQVRPEILVLDGRAVAAEAPAVVARLDSGEINYDLELSAQPDRLTRWLAGALGRPLAGDLRIYRRGSRPCVGPENVPHALEALAASGDPRLRTVIAEVIHRHPIATKRVLDGEAGEIQAVGLRFDGWSRGAEPVGLAVVNRAEAPRAPRLELGTLAPDAELPLTVTVDDGVDRQELVFTRRGQLTVALAPIPPGSARLILLQADRAWRPEGPDRRWLGVAVHRAELRAPAGDGGDPGDG